MASLPLRTSRRAAAAKANQKLLKIWNDDGSGDEKPSQPRTARNQFENGSKKQPFAKLDGNAVKAKKDEKVQKAKKVHESKAQEAAKLADEKAAAAAANQQPTDPPMDEELEQARRMEDELTRQRDHATYLERRAARMVHSDKKMVFSSRTCYNMHNKAPDSPAHSPIRAIELKRVLKYSKIVRIHRSTRHANTIIKLKNVV